MDFSMRFGPTLGFNLSGAFGPAFRASGQPPDAETPSGHWYDPISALVGESGLILSHKEGIAESVGVGVSAWADVRGGAGLIQPGVSSLRPLREAGGVFFDGVDDRLIGDAFSSLLEGPFTVLVGFHDPDSVGSSARTLFAGANTASTGTFTQVHVNFSNPAPNTTRERFYLADATTTSSVSLTDLDGMGAGPYNLALRSAGLGAEARADTLTDPLVGVGAPVTRPSGSAAYTWLTLGCRRIGGTPTNTQFWHGRVRYLVVAPSLLSDPELETIRAALSGEGLLT